jgi:predicted phage tail protein
MVVNSVFPSNFSTASASLSDTSTTYSWSKDSNPYEEGTTVPALFGKMRVTPALISSYTESDGDEQYLSLLYMIAEGQVDNITDIQVNDTNYNNYDSVSIEKRYGHNEQDVISYFGDTYSDISVYSQLNTDLSWTTATTMGNSCDGLVVVMVAPTGLWYANDEGSLSTVKVYFEIQSRRQLDASADTWDDWESWGTYSMAGSDHSTTRKSIRKDNLTQGKYEIRVAFTQTPPTGSRYGSDIYLDYIQEVYYDDFTYPNTALLAVNALATSQLSGSMPTVTCIADKQTVSVLGEDKPASNPAWASWLILTDTITGLGINENKLSYDEFEEWAEWCDEKGIYCGLYVDETLTAPNAMAMLEQLGRGRVIKRGDKYGVIVDKPSDPVQMFTVGNIIADTFEETWLSLEDRANSIQVEYWDEEYDYARTTFQVRTDPFLGDDVDIETTVTLTGCTNREIAARHAQYLLNCNKYLLRTVSFEAQIDAIACQPGDVILVQHDVPQWGYGGRVQAFEDNILTLDREIEMPLSSGSYSIMLRHSVDDSIEEHTLTTGEQTTNQVVASGAWAIDPEPGDIYSIGETNIVTKPFRVVSISKSSDLQCKITCLEYYDEIYDDEGEIPEVTQYSALTTTANLKGKTTVRKLEGLEKNVLCLTWSGSAMQWTVFKRLLGTDSPWEFIGTTTSPRFDVFNLQDNRYYQFCVTHSGSPADGKTVSVSFPGDATPAGTEAVYTSDGITVVKTSDGENVYVIGE